MKDWNGLKMEKDGTEEVASYKKGVTLKLNIYTCMHVHYSDFEGRKRYNNVFFSFAFLLYLQKMFDLYIRHQPFHHRPKNMVVPE